MAWVLIGNIAFVSLGQTRLWPLHLTFNTQSRNISGFWHAMTSMFYRSVTEVLSTYAINSMTIYICGVKDSHQNVDFFTKYWSTQASSSSLIQIYQEARSNFLLVVIFYAQLVCSYYVFYVKTCTKCINFLPGERKVEIS